MVFEGWYNTAPLRQRVGGVMVHRRARVRLAQLRGRKSSRYQRHILKHVMIWAISKLNLDVDLGVIAGPT